MGNGRRLYYRLVREIVNSLQNALGDLDLLSYHHAVIQQRKSKYKRVRNIGNQYL